MTIIGALPPTVSHSFHQKHELSLVSTGSLGFQCDGCKQFGQGSDHYRCEACDFDLHACCATAPAVVDHALFAGSSSSSFALLHDLTTQTGYMFCHACRGESVGFRYHNTDRNLYLHPCCAFLPNRVVQDGQTLELRNDAYRNCRLCMKRSKTLSYRCDYDEGGHVYLHVPCLVDAHNARTGCTNWQASAPIMKGVLGTFTRKRDAAKPILVAAKTAFAVTTLVVSVLSLDLENVAESAEAVKDAFS